MSTLVRLDARAVEALAALAAEVADYPWRAAQFADSLVAGHQLLGLQAADGALLGFAVWSQVLDDADNRHALYARLLFALKDQPDPWHQPEQALVLQARSIGLSDLVLTVTEGNSSALRLYREAGFAAFGTEPRAIVVQGIPHAKVHMHLHLT